MPRFSLIVATLDRTEEFSLLLQSLARQEMCDFELIVVDQNTDDRLSPYIEEWLSANALHESDSTNSISVKHLRSEAGVSRARNLGLEHSRGEIVAFPDDDCWYQPDTLRNVHEWFEQHPDYGVFSIGCRDEQGRVSSNRLGTQACDLNRITAFRATGACCYFVRRPSESVPFLFDESLGPGAGTPFGAGEDTDLVLTLMSHGIRARFYPLIYVGHPLRDGYVSPDRAAKYGGGWGRVLAKHSLYVLWIGLISFDLVRAILSGIRGDHRRASQLLAHGRGLAQAFFAKA